MISSGYIKVTKNHLRKLGKQQARRFIWEMLDSGGRIGHHEYEYWSKWINNNLSAHYVGTFETDTGGKVAIYADDNGLLTI